MSTNSTEMLEKVLQVVDSKVEECTSITLSPSQEDILACSLEQAQNGQTGSPE